MTEVKNNKNLLLITKAEYTLEIEKAYERGLKEGKKQVLAKAEAEKATPKVKSKVKINGEDKEFRATVTENA